MTIRDPFRVCHVHDHMANAVYVGRSNRTFGKPSSPFYNPYRIGDSHDSIPRNKTLTREQAIDLYRTYLIERPFLLRQVPDLRGKVLECWCRHYGQREPPCHADVLIELLDTYSDAALRLMR